MCVGWRRLSTDSAGNGKKWWRLTGLNVLDGGLQVWMSSGAQFVGLARFFHYVCKSKSALITFGLHISPQTGWDHTVQYHWLVGKKALYAVNSCHISSGLIFCLLCCYCFMNMHYHCLLNLLTWERSIYVTDSSVIFIKPVHLARLNL